MIFLFPQALPHQIWTFFWAQYFYVYLRHAFLPETFSNQKINPKTDEYQDFSFEKQHAFNILSFGFNKYLILVYFIRQIKIISQIILSVDLILVNSKFNFSYFNFILYLLLINYLWNIYICLFLFIYIYFSHLYCLAYNKVI